ncbi:MAG: energy transducer TonB [Betaproteobacteria bacterium]|nr:energy transducer TonB [Betaproteobacteria bacterium]
MTALGGGMRLFESENRAIRIALLVSIALHALLLFAFPGFRESQQRSKAREPFIARLIEPRIETIAAPVVAVPETRNPGHTPATKPSPRARAVPGPTPLPSTAQIASSAPELPKAEPAPAAPAAALPAAAPPAPATVAALAAPASPSGGASRPAPAPEDALDAGTLAQYRLAIISAARRYKRYPRAALDNDWQGRVEVRMTIGPGGSIAALSVRSSTGHPVLDQQALEMIERAKATAQIPQALQGREFVVDIPVIFSLREPDA